MPALNPAYSNISDPFPAAYLRADLLQGIRFQDKNDPKVIKRRDAVVNGTRYDQNDPDIGWGIRLSPAQTWNKVTQRWDFDWQWIPAMEEAVRRGKSIYLRPFSAVGAHFVCIPSNLKRVTGTSRTGTWTAVDMMHEPTHFSVLDFYAEFYKNVFLPYKDNIIAIDACLAGSVDGGQPSLRGHTLDTIMDVFGFTRERILQELQYQFDLFGLATIGHLSPNGSSVPIDSPASDHWLNQWFADVGCMARRQDSRPFRETNATENMARKANWDVDLDIFEITGGNLSAWTKNKDGYWDNELRKFYGTSWPKNVEDAFSIVKRRGGFIWPMHSYPSKSAEPQYYTHYLEGNDGAMVYLPAKIDTFVSRWRSNVLPPPTNGGDGGDGPPPVVGVAYALKALKGCKIVRIDTTPTENPGWEDLIGDGLIEVQIVTPNPPRVWFELTKPMSELESIGYMSEIAVDDEPLDRVDADNDPASYGYHMQNRGSWLAVDVTYETDEVPVDEYATKEEVAELRGQVVMLGTGVKNLSDSLAETNVHVENLENFNASWD